MNGVGIEEGTGGSNAIAGCGNGMVKGEKKRERESCRISE